MKHSKSKMQLSAFGMGMATICLVGIVIYSSQKTKEAKDLDETARAIASATGKKTSVASAATTPEQLFRQHMDFERDVRQFIRDNESWTPTERQRRAQDLALRIEEREKTRYVNAGEAFKLKMMLIRATEPDEQKQNQRIADLALRYQAEAERQQTAFLDTQKRDPRFQAYKSREAQIVAEVGAMRSFPGGMSRDEYLRQRLLEARAAIYYAPAPTGAQASPGPQQAPTP